MICGNAENVQGIVSPSASIMENGDAVSVAVG